MEVEEETQTVTYPVFVPDYQRVTEKQTQTQEVTIRRNEYEEVTRQYDFPITTSVTEVETVTKPIVKVHKSGVLVPQVTLHTSTKIDYFVVTETKQTYGYPEVDVVTSREVEYQPSLVTITTQLVEVHTITSVQRVPVYVTQTLKEDCYGYGGYNG